MSLELKRRQVPRALNGEGEGVRYWSEEKREGGLFAGARRRVGFAL